MVPSDLSVLGDPVGFERAFLAPYPLGITITTRLVDTVTTPMLLKIVQSRKLDPKWLITHRFSLDHILDAYDTFGRAADTQALKVIIEA